VEALMPEQVVEALIPEVVEALMPEVVEALMPEEVVEALMPQEVAARTEEPATLVVLKMMLALILKELRQDEIRTFNSKRALSTNSDCLKYNCIRPMLTIVAAQSRV